MSRLDVAPVQHVNEIKYLGVVVTAGGNEYTDNLSKVAKGKIITRRLNFTM